MKQGIEHTCTLKGSVSCGATKLNEYFMKKTSIHFEKCNAQKSENHNERRHEYDYIFKELSKNNESKYFDNRSLLQIENNCKELYKSKVGQSMQKKTAPLREAVVVIDEHTTMQDLENLVSRIESHLKWKPLQIHIHRDEGYVKSGDNKGGHEVAKLNLHAHLVFNCQDQENGRMHKFTKDDLREMQTYTAEILGMQRGKASNRKHIRSMEYRMKMIEENSKKLNQDLDELKKDIEYNQYIHQGDKEEFEHLSKEIQRLEDLETERVNEIKEIEEKAKKLLKMRKEEAEEFLEKIQKTRKKKWF